MKQIPVSGAIHVMEHMFFFFFHNVNWMTFSSAPGSERQIHRSPLTLCHLENKMGRKPFRIHINHYSSISISRKKIAQMDLPLSLSLGKDPEA